MTKLEFMKELESLLSDIPLEEREEALNYYNGYIEDAGEEHEEDILKELGSPVKVAGIIKADLNLNEVDRESSGYFTEKGYQDTTYADEKFEIMGGKKTNANGQNQEAKTETGSNHSENNQNSSQGFKAQNQANNNGMRIVLIIGLCIFGFPLIMSAFGVLIGVVATVLGIIVGFGATGVALFITGIVMFIAGLTEITVPFVGIALCGSGMILFGLGILFLMVTTFLCKTVIPAIFKGVVYICKMPFQNRSVIA